MPRPAADEIAELLHAGPGTGGILTAAQQLRSHATHLGQSAHGVNSAAAQVSSDWSSESGMHAAHRLGELGTWFEQHAEQARALAATMDHHAASFARAKAAVPTPEQFRDVENRLVAAAAANANPANMGRYAPVVAALQAQLAHMNAQALTAYCGTYATESTTITGTALQPPPKPGGALKSIPDGEGIIRPVMSEGAAAGPNAGPGVPPSIVGGGPAVERPIYPLDPNGAMPGSGVTGGVAPVSYTGPPQGLIGGDLFGGDEVEEPVPIQGARSGPNVGARCPCLDRRTRQTAHLTALSYRRPLASVTIKPGRNRYSAELATQS